MSASYILMIAIISFFVGMIIDYILFRIWHNMAHSEEFKKLEKERKEKENIWRYE